MFCRRCGEEIRDETVICPKCGCETGFTQYANTNNYGESKTGVGVLCGLFLGILGLIIGLCIYKPKTIQMRTFVNAWFTTIIVEVICIFALVSCVAFNRANI